MGIGFSELIIILILVFVIFGAGKLPKVMGDIGKGIRNMREGLQKDEEAENAGKTAEKTEESKKD